MDWRLKGPVYARAKFVHCYNESWDPCITHFLGTLQLLAQCVHVNPLNVPSKGPQNRLGQPSWVSSTVFYEKKSIIYNPRDKNIIIEIRFHFWIIYLWAYKLILFLKYIVLIYQDIFYVINVYTPVNHVVRKTCIVLKRRQKEGLNTTIKYHK